MKVHVVGDELFNPLNFIYVNKYIDIKPFNLCNIQRLLIANSDYSLNIITWDDWRDDSHHKEWQFLQIGDW
jgi:hypothetical protein